MPNSTVPEKTSGIEHPCLRCGACCAFFRASFYWAEADDVSPGGVPVKMTRKLNDFRRSMLGMDGGNPRCIALQGEIGKRVFCSIYDSRASVCRDFEPSWENNRPNERCDRARAAWGLEPLKPGDWEEWSRWSSSRQSSSGNVHPAAPLHAGVVPDTMDVLVRPHQPEQDRQPG